MPSPQTLAKKQKSIDALAEIFKNNGVFLFDYRGLKVSEFETLRKQIKEISAHVKVIKNKLAIKFFEKEKLDFSKDSLCGPTAVVYSNDKYVEAAKVLIDFEKENKKIKIKSGFIERRLVDEKQIAYVAKLPAKEQLMAQLAFAIASPLKKFGAALSAPLTHMLIVLKNLKDKKEKGG